MLVSGHITRVVASASWWSKVAGHKQLVQQYNPGFLVTSNVLDLMENRHPDNNM